MSHRVVVVSLVAALCSAAAIAIPALGDSGPSAPPDPQVMPAQDPPTPTPAPGETNIPPVGNASEDDHPASATERDRALEQQRAVAACVRDKGQAIPDPVAHSADVQLGWDGPPNPALEAAIAECDPALR